MVNYKTTHYNKYLKRLSMKQATPNDLNNIPDDIVDEIFVKHLLIKKSEKINKLPKNLKILKIDKIFTYDDQSGEYMSSNSKDHMNAVTKNTTLPINCILEFGK